MKRRQPEDLLQEIFADDALAALREESLAAGLAAQRDKRRARALRTTALAVVPLAILTAALLLRTKPEIPAPAPRIVAAATVPTREPAIKIYPVVSAKDLPPVATISDEELLALFKDRDVALIGSAGHQKLVVFDQPNIGG